MTNSASGCLPEPMQPCSWPMTMLQSHTRAAKRGNVSPPAGTCAPVTCTLGASPLEGRGGRGRDGTAAGRCGAQHRCPPCSQGAAHSAPHTCVEPARGQTRGPSACRNSSGRLMADPRLSARAGTLGRPRWEAGLSVRQAYNACRDILCQGMLGIVSAVLGLCLADADATCESMMRGGHSK